MIYNYFNEVVFLFIMMAPYLMLGFIISGLLYIITSKEMISNNIGKPGLMSIIKASVLGVPMPLCSCGVIPVTTSIYKRGASKSAALSFLISTPQTGVDSIFITYSMMGLPFAIIRPLIALITGIIGGVFTEIFIEKDYESKSKINHAHDKKTISDGVKYAFITLPQDISLPLIQGILISGVISILVPADFFISYNLTGSVAMVLIALSSIPIYVCATASVPIAMTLISKGLDPGAALVFLMAGPATNIATINVIMKTMGKKLVNIYVITIFVSSMFFGTLINLFLNRDSLPMINQLHHHHFDILSILSAAALLLICTNSIFISKKSQSFKEKINDPKADLSLIIKGMTCNHCKETAEEAINSCDNVENLKINLESGQALIYGSGLVEEDIISAINNSGFSVGKNS